MKLIKQVKIEIRRKKIQFGTAMKCDDLVSQYNLKIGKLSKLCLFLLNEISVLRGYAWNFWKRL